MFTGIIEHVGRIDSLEKLPGGARLRVDAGPLAASLAVSASIAVNGCCLTAVEIAGNIFTADLSAETLRRTSLGEMKPGARVNLERPLTAGKELGGHFVQGHVDGVGRVTRLAPAGPGCTYSPEKNDGHWWLGVRVPAEIERYVAMKGSIAIDGISLTVARLADGIVEAAIIPFTYSHTNLQSLALGDAVNVEVDILAKYVERLLESRRAPASSRLTVARLVEEGF
jgi:riboflavin synthase